MLTWQNFTTDTSGLCQPFIKTTLIKVLWVRYLQCDSMLMQTCAKSSGRSLKNHENHKSSRVAEGNVAQILMRGLNLSYLSKVSKCQNINYQRQRYFDIPCIKNRIVASSLYDSFVKQYLHSVKLRFYTNLSTAKSRVL